MSAPMFEVEAISPEVDCGGGCIFQYRKCVNAGGKLFVKQQCVWCGKAGESHVSFARVQAETGLPVDALQDFDAAAQDALYEREKEALERDWRAKRQAARAEWLDRASPYYQSAEWKARRLAVFERDKRRCQACIAAVATEVHHLTYKHFGAEPLFDLVAVCKACHDAITAMDNA